MKKNLIDYHSLQCILRFISIMVQNKLNIVNIFVIGLKLFG